MDDSVTYLWSAATQLSNSSPALQVLKAYYAERAITLSGRTCNFPEGYKSVSSMCSNCSSLWSNGASKLTLKAAQKPRRRTRNFVIKHYRDKKSPKLKRISRRLALRSFNYVELTCSVCKELTRIPFVRSSRKKGVPEQVSPRNNPIKRFPNSPLTNPPKQKKKKKDPFAGLNREAILLAQRKPQKPDESFQRPSIGKLATILKKKASISGNKLDSMLK